MNENRIKIDRSLTNQIDYLMIAGYLQRQNNQTIAASQTWYKAWLMIAELLRTYPDASIESINDAFTGKESIINWARDFEMELTSAALQDPAFYRICIDFCHDFLARSQDPTRIIHFALKRSIAVCYFRLGQQSEGDSCFAEITQQHPYWAWGWLGWANQYSFYTKDPWYNLEKAEQILREGLKVADSDGKEEIVRKLRRILIDQGKTIEASIIS
jgi:hypothetical protein